MLSGLSRLQQTLDEGVEHRIFPAATAWISVGHAEPVVLCAGDGTPGTVWDLASLTKPMVIVWLVMRSLADRRLSLDEQVAGGKSVLDLLGHSSGLPAHEELVPLLDERWQRWTPGSAEVLFAIGERLRALAEVAVAGEQVIYSDLGYILLGWHLEARLGRSLRRLVPGFGPVDPRRAAPTGWCPWRKRQLRGEVHDANAWALGGSAGHAGMFGSAAVVGEWARDLLDASLGRSASVDGGVVRELWSPTQKLPGASWVLGWDTPSGEASTAGRRAGPGSVGHLGFTGTSVWIDPSRDLVTVLLTNRVALPDTGAANRTFRTRFHDVVHDWVDGIGGQ